MRTRGKGLVHSHTIHVLSNSFLPVMYTCSLSHAAGRYSWNECMQNERLTNWSLAGRCAQDLRSRVSAVWSVLHSSLHMCPSFCSASSLRLTGSIWTRGLPGPLRLGDFPGSTSCTYFQFCNMHHPCNTCTVLLFVSRLEAPWGQEFSLDP